MKVLLPTDFSENADLATQIAIDIVKRTEGRLQVLHGYDLPYSERSMTTSLLEEMKLNADRHMKEFDDDVLSKSNVPYESEVRMGNPIRLIKETAQNKNSNLVVMGTKGASGLEEFLIGSNAASVIQNIDIPVLVVPPKTEVKPFKKIVLASDLDLHQKKRPLERLRSFAKIYDSTIEILHLQTSKGVESGQRDFVLEVLHDVPHNYSVKKVEGNVDKAILDHCTAKGADLVTAITKKYGFFEGLFHQSITSKLAYHTSIPMLALHEPK